ncbi:MAG: VOC family protein [Actinobacteria bacterium]|nr:VOC family protein [Actinomycetota bacterium]
MGTKQLHHSGILVSDMDRSARFYIEALDGHWLFKPTAMTGATAQKTFGGGPDAAVLFAYIGFEEGAVELVQFTNEPADYAIDPKPARLPHFALMVDDVKDTIARIEAAGGSRVWDEPVDWNGALVCYVADPDGNVMELFDAPLDKIVEMTIGLFPDSAP